MNKFGLKLVSVLILLIAVHPVLYADDAGEPLRCDVKKAGLDSEKFYLYITKDTPYASWKLWPEKSKFYQGSKPHGVFLTTYVNPVAYRSIADKDGMAFGSIIVMENYDAGKQLKELSVMMKIKGYNPDVGGWHWLQYSRDGKPLAEGRVESCINCHGAKKENSYIMTEPVK